MRAAPDVTIARNLPKMRVSWRPRGECGDSERIALLWVGREVIRRQLTQLRRPLDDVVATTSSGDLPDNSCRASNRKFEFDKRRRASGMTVIRQITSHGLELSRAPGGPDTAHRL